MEKLNSLYAANKTVAFWAIWFPAFVHKSRFESIENPISGIINDPIVSEKAKGKSCFTKFIYKNTKKYYDNANIPIHITFVRRNDQSPIDKGDDIVNCDIILKYTTNDTKQDKIVVLKYLQHSANGLFSYECLSDSDQTVRYIEKHATAYHIKKACHLHLFHGDDSAKADYDDYYFKIFSTKEKPNINEKNNEAIKYYLRSFCDRYNKQISFFEQFLCPLNDRVAKRNLSTHIEERKSEENVALGLGLIDRESVKKDDDTKTIEIFDGHEYDKDKLLNRYNQLLDNEKQTVKEYAKFLNLTILATVQEEPIFTISEKFNNKKKYEESIFIIGETLFINTLRNSKYLKPDSDDEVRKYLLNLENLTKTLYFIRDYYRYKHEEKENSKSLKITKWLAGLGFVFSLVTFVCGFWYAIYSAKESTKLFNETQELINQNTEILKQSLQQNDLQTYQDISK